LLYNNVNVITGRRISGECQWETSFIEGIEYMYTQRQLSSLTVCAIILVTLISANHLLAQFNDTQSFNGTVGSEFAVSPHDVDYWSVDGSCSPAIVFRDGTRGDNGSKCLKTLLPLGVGTRMVFDLNPGAGNSTISDMNTTGLAVIWRLWLSADDGSGTAGKELYRVLGPNYTVTTLETDINPGTGSSDPQDLFLHTPNGLGNLYFSADDGTNGRELWRNYTDKDLSTTTSLLANINPGAASSNPSEFAAVNDGNASVVVFAADDGTNGRELWVTVEDGNGNPVSASMLKNINAGGASSDPQQMTRVIFDYLVNNNVKAFFTADDGANGRELWRTDGTLSGTGLVQDIVTGATGSNPTNLTATTIFYNYSATPALAFTVNSDGANGTELWLSRGNAADTSLYYDPGAAGSPANLTATHNDSFSTFFTVGNGLYHIFGNPAYDNLLLKTFNSPPTNLVAVGDDTIYFVADDGGGAGTELWKSVVNTTTGAVTTSLVKDIRPGAASSNPTNLVAVGGAATFAANVLYFSADDGTNGRELWRSDSTAGAVLVKDIYPGALSSNPSNLMNFDQMYLFFTADDGTHGIELWQSDGYDTPPHNGMNYKWDLSDDIDGRGDPSKIAVAGTDSNVFSVYWLFDFPAMGGADGISEAAHQVNTYVELTDGTDRAPLDISYVDCGDGNITRPKAALTDSSNHNAIAFGMVAVLDQNPCDTDARGPNSPSAPFARVPAVYDGYEWIPMDLVNFPAGVPTNPGTSQVMGELVSDGYMPTGWPGGLVAATEDPWLQKRFAWARIDVLDDYIAVFLGNHQYAKIWVATLPRQYKGAFKSLYFGNSACIQPAYPFYLDSLMLNGGVFTTTVNPFGACCHPNGVCEDSLTAGECDGTYTPWMTCDDPALPPCCPTPWADADSDGDVDQEDFGLWQTCYSATGIAYPAGCACYDRNDSTGALGGDGDVDLDDLAWFENCFGGPTLDPLPGCIP